jgi:hypothetical protein
LPVASPCRPGSARISSTLAPFGRFALSPPLLISSQALPRLRQVSSLFLLWLSPRPVTHRHLTRARPTSPGTPRPFNCTRPSARLALRTLSAHRLGPLPRCPLSERLALLPTHPALPSARARPAARLGSYDMGPGTQPATHHSPSARLVASATPGDRDQAASARTQHLMLSTLAHGAAASRRRRHAESLPLPRSIRGKSQ